MRSAYEDTAGIATATNNHHNNHNNNITDLTNKYHNNNNNNNNNNSYYKNYNNSAVGGSGGGGTTIPYHARENSLPFSYGHIGATSTPLRKTPTPTKSDSFLDFDFAATTSSSVATATPPLTNLHGSGNNNDSNNNNSNGNMIKTQPRLTSPLLVRKTLGSRSPSTTNSSNHNTNTISNTYHYKYNGNATPTSLPIQPRDDFERLLRERREKVFNEYRVPPTPPQRHHYPPPTTTTATAAQTALLTNGRRHNNANNSKYHYDFEFNLNLNDDRNVDVDVDALPRPPLPLHYNNTTQYTNTMPYQTRNIDVTDGATRGNSRTTSTFVERNYHTINGGSNGAAQPPTPSSQSPFDERPPLEVTYKRQAAATQTATRSSHSNTTATYGNGTGGGSVYGQSHHETLTRNRRDLSPIYATTTKQQQHRSQLNGGPNTNGQPDYLTPSPTTPPTSVGRPETPAFPVTPRTPHTAYPYGSHTLSSTTYGNNHQSEAIYQTSSRPRLNSSSLSSTTNGQEQPQEVAAHLVKFARNSAKFWYKANLSREDAIALLLHAPPGTFVVRDSTTYKNAYGLVLRVAQPPPGSSGDQPQDLVRHFLIEPTQRGVRLKGCANEPVFTSLSALVYEHSINQLALPCLLQIPETDIVPSLAPAATTAAHQQLLLHGAATNVLWLYSCDTESLTGNEAIRKAIRQLYAQSQPQPQPTEVHFKVTQQGITLTDNTRKKFFRKHYTADVISHCAIDPDNRLWSDEKKTIFAFVARRSHSSKDNQCHVFCDLTTAQPAVAIVAFANRTLPTEKQRNYVL